MDGAANDAPPRDRTAHGTNQLGNDFEWYIDDVVGDEVPPRDHYDAAMTRTRRKTRDAAGRTGVVGLRPTACLYTRARFLVRSRREA